jgi:ubiquinol-cytochrome c reductase cytochrome b subunit
MRTVIRKILDWVDHRTGLETAVKDFLYEDIPASSGWHQVFGSVALFLFLVQAFTGVLLAINYAPTPGEAYHSLRYIIEELTGGRLLRGLHHWGASAMIVVVGLHLVQVAIWGAYRKPREATWLVGVLLLLLVLAFGLTGYLLPWDNRAYWATVVTVEISGLAPGLGDYIKRFLGSQDGSIGAVTFARFYGLHTMLLPFVTTFLILFHVYLVRKHGVAPAPEDVGRPPKKFYPGQAFKDTVAVFIAFVILFTLAVVVDAPLERMADPNDRTYIPRPEWYFLFLFQTLKFFEGSLEVVGAIVLPTLAILGLALVPFLDRSQLTRVWQRTFAMTVVGLLAIGWTSLTIAAIVTTPKQSERPVVDGGWTLLSPAELAGYSHFRASGCESCHNILDGPPKAGPTLATLAQRKPLSWTLAHLQDPGTGEPTPAASLPRPQRNALAAFAYRIMPEVAMRLDETPDYAIAGALIYEKNNCGVCHMVNGAGTTIGPSLNGLAGRRDKVWIIGHFREPEEYSPGTSMPAYDFPPDEMEAITMYLMALP